MATWPRVYVIANAVQLVCVSMGCAAADSKDPVGELERGHRARIGGTEVTAGADRMVFEDPVEASDYWVALLAFVIAGCGVIIAWMGASRVLAVAMGVIATGGVLWQISHERLVVIDIQRRDVTVRDGVLWGIYTKSYVTKLDQVDGVLRVSRVEESGDDVAHFVGVALQREETNLVRFFEKRVHGYVEVEQRKAAAMRDHIAARCGLPSLER